MTSTAQKSNMPAKVNAFMKAFMVKAKDEMDEDTYDVVLALWEGKENQAELTETFKSERNSGGKKLKDKNKPKRGKSAYIFFCGANRAKAKAELDDDATLGDVGKKLGEMWQAAKASGNVKKYIKMAEKDKKRYAKEMETYVRPSDEELEEQNKGKRKKRSKKKKSNKKRGKSAYMFFCAEMRSEIKEDDPDMSSKEVMVELGKRWRTAKEGDTSKWDKMAQKSKDEAAKANSSDEDGMPTPPPSDEEDELVEEKPVKKKARKKKAVKPTWKVVDDAKSGKKYYYNTKTKKTRWTKPDEMDEEEAPAKKKSSKKKSAKKKSAKKKGTGKRIYAMSYWKKQNKDDIAEETGLEGVELTKEMSKRWKAMSKADKEEWKTKAQAEA